MYPLFAQLPNRENDYGIEIKGEASSSGLTQDEKGKTKKLSMIQIEEVAMMDDHLAMVVAKRSTKEKEGQ